jgi:hypothetical protein
MASKLNIFSALFCAAAVSVSFSPSKMQPDDFGRIVHRIEASYHVHRDHRFLMGLSGLVVRFCHIGGIKNLKMAVFEHQHFDFGAADSKLDDLVLAAASSGWRPVVRSFSRRTGECAHIYLQEEGHDAQLLIVSVERDEAVVVQLQFDADKLIRFLDQAAAGHADHRLDFGAIDSH